MHVYFKQRDGARQVLNCHELQIAGRQLLLCARRCRMAASCPCIDISNAALFCVTSSMFVLSRTFPYTATVLHFNEMKQ